MTTRAGPRRFQDYQDFFEIVGRYWTAYGGWHAFYTSPYVHLGILITFLCSGFWMASPWHNSAISLLPNLLGFGVSGFAIWIGWGDEKLRDTLMDIDNDPKGSLYIQTSAIFAHFGLVQFVALFIALLCNMLDYELSEKSMLASIFNLAGLPVYFFWYLRPVGFFIGFFFFSYAILTAFETTLALFRLAGWLQLQRRAERLRQRLRQSPNSSNGP